MVNCYIGKLMISRNKVAKEDRVKDTLAKYGTVSRGNCVAHVDDNHGNFLFFTHGMRSEKGKRSY